MNHRIILAALEKVEEVGYISPTSDPPDILGVLLNTVASDGKGLGEKLDLIKMRCEIDHRDVDKLLSLSEDHSLKETPKQRRDRLRDHFASLVEAEDGPPFIYPDDFNLAEAEEW